MPNISEIIGLTTAASSSGLAVADSELIKGAFQVFSTLARLQAAPTARLTDGQIVWVEGESALYQLSITLANPPFTFTDTYTWNEFTGFGGGSVPAGTISGSSQIAELGYILSSQTSSFVLSSQTSSFALKTEISGAFTETSSSISTRLTSLEAGGGNVPDGTISSSQQITDLGFINQSQTSSMSVATASYVDPTFISASAAASGFGTATLPSGVLSSSAQIAVEISGAFTEVSGGLAGRITTLEGTSGGDVTESIVTSVVTNNGLSYYIIDDIEKPKLSFAPGLTYRFNLSGIVGSHPFKFSTSPNGPTQYTTGVTSGSGFIQIEVGYNTTTPLYYYCTNHNGMGNEINVLQIEKLITNSQTSSMSVLSALTASFISDTFISASAARSGFGVGGGSTDVSALNTFTGSIQTQVDSLTAETSSYLTSADTASFILVSQTSSMSVLSALTASYLIGGAGSIDTSSFVTNDQTSSFILVSQTSSMSVLSALTASFISDTFISASAARSGFGGGSSIDTSSFITNDQTSSFLLISETGSFLTAADTSSFVLVSQTSSMSVATASYIDPTFISSSAAAAGFGSGGGGSTPAGTVSGSQQIADLGYINQTQTSSMSVLSASYAVTASYAAVLEIGSEISGPGFSINQDGILTLSATSETGSLGAGSIWYDGNDFYFNV